VTSEPDRRARSAGHDDPHHKPYDPKSPETEAAIRDLLAIKAMIKRPPPLPPFNYFNFKR
jgi:hypothetical protein